MTKKIYGIDPSKKFTALDVRDAIIQCFKNAHKKILDDYEEYNITEMSKKEIEDLKALNVEIMIDRFCKDMGSNPKKPNKKDLKKLIDKLAEFAKNFRSEKIIKKHYNEIMKLIEKLD